MPKWEDCPVPLGSSPQQLMGVGLMPLPTDGSHQLPIPTDELAVGGGPPSPHAVWSRCRISGPSAPVRAAALLRTPGGAWEGVSGPSAPAPFPLTPCLEARGDECQGPRHLLYPPSLNLREDDRLLVGLSVHALVSVRGEGDGGLGVLCCIGLHGHPRVREGEMPETSGAS